MIPIVVGYASLRLIWWGLLGILLIGFAIMDGFDLGVAMVLPWVARNDLERRVVINSIAAVWEGNQVWLILGAGAIFAAWPMIYAVAFSGFYLAMMLVLFALILRPVAFKYRSKIQDKHWRQTWDTILSISGVVCSLIFGVAIGNVIIGAPFYFDADLRMFYTGNLLQLLTPFPLLCGFVSVSMLLMQGSNYLVVKCNGLIRERAIKISQIAAILMIVLFALAGIWVALGIDGYIVTSRVIQDGPSNPLYKTVEKVTGGWLYNYRDHRSLIVMPLLGFLGAFISSQWVKKGSGKLAMVASSCAILGVIATVGVSLFPFMLPSSSVPGASLLVWDSSSSHLTLYIMFIAAIIFMPIILTYVSWVYRILRGKMTDKYINSNQDSAY